MIQVKVTWSNHCGTEPQWARVLCLGPPYTESFHSSTQPDPLSSPRASPRVRTPSTILYTLLLWTALLGTNILCMYTCINICTQKGHLHNIHFQLCTASHTLTSPIYICTPHLPNIATLAPGRGATTATKVTCLFAILFIFFALVYLWFFILAHISSLEFAWNPSESFYCLFIFWSFCLSFFCLSVLLPQHHASFILFADIGIPWFMWVHLGNLLLKIIFILNRVFFNFLSLFL